MKKIIIISIIFSTLCGCQEVVILPLDTVEPKLVVEAAILWKKGTTGNTQTIKLSTTGDFYGTTIPTVSGANVTVINNKTKVVFNFVEGSVAGDYTCTDFEPIIDDEYSLKVEVNGISYVATEVMKSVPVIKEVKQSNSTIDGGESEYYDIKATFDDPEGKNFYMFTYSTNNSPFNDETYIAADNIYDGQEFFSTNPYMSYYLKEKVYIYHYGISEGYYNYMNLIMNAMESGSGGGMFDTIPVPVIGNVVNTSNVDKNPLGYFSLSEVTIVEHVIVSLKVEGGKE